MSRLWVMREKGWKKTLSSVLLSCVIVGSLLAGCGTKTENSAAAPEQQTGEVKASAEATMNDGSEEAQERTVTDELLCPNTLWRR